MEREVKENLDSIVEILEKNFSQEGVFEHILKQIEKHIDELRELKSSGDIHLYAEVADLLLLSKVLIELEEITGLGTIFIIPHYLAILHPGHSHRKCIPAA